MTTLVVWLQLAAALTAGLAAHYWYNSDKVPVPDQFGVPRYASKLALKEYNLEKIWAKNTSVANARGAISAAVSAILTAVSLVIQAWASVS